MNIVVCVKRVPDTEARVRIADDQKSVQSDGVKYVLNPYDEFAVEAALQLVEAAGEGEVTLLSLGPEGTKETLRSGLAMGAHGAVLLKGEPSMDGLATSEVLAAELAGNEAPLVLFGVKAIDDDQQQVGLMTAELLGRPCAASVTEMSVDGETVTCRRAVEGGSEVVEMDLPAVVTVTKGKYEPRYASLKGIMAAKKKPLEEKDAALVPSTLVLERLELPPARPDGRIVGEGLSAVPEVVRALREEAKVL
ncbi:MAG: electron transfer flavoprotein subunit beta/FixA family protein [Longimicrobiales bacterium]